MKLLKDYIKDLPKDTYISLFGKGYKYITSGNVKWITLDKELDMMVKDIIVTNDGKIHYYLDEVLL